MALVQIRYDGDLVIDNRVSMRTLGNTLFHIQNAIDRAYLDIAYDGGVWKYARLPGEARQHTDFRVELPEAGSFLQKFFSISDSGDSIVDRLTQAIAPAIDRASQTAEAQGEELRAKLAGQVATRRNQIQSGISQPRYFEDAIAHQDDRVVRAYGDRSIVKELDQVASIVRSNNAGESVFDLTVSGVETRTFTFDRETAERFRRIVTEKQLGDPVIYTGELLRLDKQQLNGKFKNAISNKVANIIMADESDFRSLHPYLAENQVHFIGAPVIEYGAFDPRSGDVYFIGLA